MANDYDTKYDAQVRETKRELIKGSFGWIFMLITIIMLILVLMLLNYTIFIAVVIPSKNDPIANLCKNEVVNCTERPGQKCCRNTTDIYCFIDGAPQDCIAIGFTLNYLEENSIYHATAVWAGISVIIIASAFIVALAGLGFAFIAQRNWNNQINKLIRA